MNQKKLFVLCGFDAGGTLNPVCCVEARNDFEAVELLGLAVVNPSPMSRDTMMVLGARLPAGDGEGWLHVQVPRKKKAGETLESRLDYETSGSLHRPARVLAHAAYLVLARMPAFTPVATKKARKSA